MSDLVRLHEFGSVPAPSHEEREAAELAVDLEAFIADEAHSAPPLLGNEHEAIIPTGGLVVVAGQSGVGKTTLVLDAVFHLVSGKSWLDLHCDRPLSVLIIENEGPREQFRRKLAAKRERWADELAGDLWIHTWRWGAFSLADMEAVVHLGGFCEDNGVDLVVGDPLGTMGILGVGSPEDTREFVARLRVLGLMDHRAFLFLHHFRKDKASDELDQISGAWGPHLDTLLIVKPGRRDQMRLSFPKVRWSEQPRKAMILDRVRATQGFEFSHEEGDPRALLPDIVEWLERDHAKGQTAKDIATGIGSRRDVTTEVLEGNEHLFHSRTGDAAKELGRARNAVVWTLVPGTGTRGTRVENVLQNGGVVGAPDSSPSLEGGGEEGTPQPFETQMPLHLIEPPSENGDEPHDELDWR